MLRRYPGHLRRNWTQLAYYGRATRLSGGGLARHRGSLGEIQQRRGDAPADVGVVDQVELREDRIDVLLDRPLREEELLGDRRIRPALGDPCQHLALACRQLGE